MRGRGRRGRGGEEGREEWSGEGREKEEGSAGKVRGEGGEGGRRGWGKTWRENRHAPTKGDRARGHKGCSCARAQRVFVRGHERTGNLVTSSRWGVIWWITMGWVVTGSVTGCDEVTKWSHVRNNSLSFVDFDQR